VCPCSLSSHLRLSRVSPCIQPLGSENVFALRSVILIQNCFGLMLVFSQGNYGCLRKNSPSSKAKGLFAPKEFGRKKDKNGCVWSRLRQGITR